MEKETKKIITREGVKNGLIQGAKSSLHLNIYLLSLLTLVLLIPSICYAIYIAKRILIMGFIIPLPFAVIPIVFTKYIIDDLTIMQLAKQDGFSIVKDRVDHLVNGESPKNSSEGRNPVDVIYFEKYGRCTASKTTFALASVGDVFYIVILHKKKKKPHVIYHSLIYECNEIDTDL